MSVHARDTSAREFWSGSVWHLAPELPNAPRARAGEGGEQREGAEQGSLEQKEGRGEGWSSWEGRESGDSCKVKVAVALASLALFLFIFDCLSLTRRSFSYLHKRFCYVY